MADDPFQFAVLGDIDTYDELDQQLDDPEFAHRCARAMEAFVSAVRGGQEALASGRFWNASLGLYISRAQSVYCFFALGTRPSSRPVFLLARRATRNESVEAIYDEAARRLAILKES